MSSLYSSPPSSPKRSADSNLQSFVESVTPLVSSNLIPKASWTNAKAPRDNFNLKDLWACLEKWSVYGVGVPVLLNDGDTVVQYYTPYLSAIQIYTIENPSILLRPHTVSETVGQSSSDSFKIPPSSDDKWDDNAMLSPGGAPVAKNPLGHIYFEYSEKQTPKNRVHLDKKISCLSGFFPGIVSFNSADLAPASWMSIAWEPIYQIPKKVDMKVKDLSTSFLTYHTLSSYLEGDKYEDINKKISLHSFGLVCSNMRGDIWLTSKKDCEKMGDMYSAADSWLKQIKYDHYDFYCKNH